MMRALIFSLLLIISACCHFLSSFNHISLFNRVGQAARQEIPSKPQKVYPGKPLDSDQWDKAASFPGGTTPFGLERLQLFVWQHVKWATLSPREGRVFAAFTVDEQGHIHKLRIQKSLDASHDQEVLRVLRLMPVWKPASLRGKPVAQPVTVPILFTQAARRDWAK